MNQKIKTAFILATVNYGIYGTSVITYLVCAAYFTNVLQLSASSALLLVAMVTLTCLVCSIVALSYIRGVREYTRKEKPFVIVTRVLSIVGIVSSAIILFYALIIYSLFGISY